jgi:hypothetical protein
VSNPTRITVRVVASLVVAISCAYAAMTVDLAVRGPCARPQPTGRYVPPVCVGPEANYWIAAVAAVVAAILAWIVVGRGLRYAEERAARQRT